jgi:hypothetical protein
MGVSNLKVGLSRKYASWAGERVKLNREIAKIREAMAILGEKEARVERLETLLECSKVIMSELDASWDADAVKPSLPKGKKLPYDPGLVTRWAMDFIREADGSFSSLQIARHIVQTQGGDLDDPDLVDRVRGAVDNSLRAKLGKYVRYVSQRPTMWAKIQDDDDLA